MKCSLIFERIQRQLSFSLLSLIFSICYSLCCLFSPSPSVFSRFLLLLLFFLYISLSLSLDFFLSYLLSLLLSFSFSVPLPCPPTMSQNIFNIFPAANEPKLPNHISSTRISLTFALQARVRSQCPCSSCTPLLPLSLSFCLSVYLPVSTVCNPACVAQEATALRTTCVTNMSIRCPRKLCGADFLRGNTRGQEVRQARQECRGEEEKGRGGGTRHMKNVEV